MKASSVNRADDSISNSERLLAAADGSQITEDAYAPGKILAGKYRVDRVLGEGAMGIVLAATHLELDERVAIKFIRPEMQKMPGVVARFAREAKATRRINSEHTANVLDVGVSSQLGPYIVMEYLEGKDLADILADRGALPPRRAVEYVMQACEALALAHVNDITHRDIKPENLFLIRRGDLEIIKLLDFGISKAALTGRVFGDELSTVETSCLMGTPLYMSPEQIRATADVDHRTDIWSLGAVLYELITGRTAFVADSVTQVCAMVLETEPPPIAQFCPTVSPDLQAVIDRCMQKDPNKRFQNMAELAVALQPFAPSRARMHADRSTSILRNSGVDISIDTRSSMPAAGTSGVISVNVPASPKLPTQPSIALPAETLPESSTRPVTEATSPSFAVPARKRRGVPLAALGAVVVLGIGAFVFASRGEPPRAPATAARAPAAQTVPQPAKTAQPQQEMPAIRSIIVDSQPSDAQVEASGKVLGRTPLRAVLPIGPQVLHVTKSGYGDAQVSINIERAAKDAEPMRQLVLLEKQEEGKRGAYRARPVARSVVRGQAAAPTVAAFDDVPPTKNSASTSEVRPTSKETKPRVRLGLVEDQPRAKLVE